ncbi:MAG: MarR family transcriptional regulator [Methanomassiliicoccales archaeon]|nr:MarR family transcriptional regulator [Methanomassiliicoccales archaeon]
MVAVLGTLGFRPESLMPTLKSCDDLSEVVVFVSEHPDSAKAAARIKEYCQTLDIRFRLITLQDAFDLLHIAEIIKAEVRKVKNEGERIAVFNIAGGTRLMSAAALLVCIVQGLNSAYVHDDTLKEIPLPLLQMEYSSVLTPAQRNLLQMLLQSENGRMSQGELAEKMGLHKATINHHIKELLDKGAIHLEPKPGDRRTKIIKVEESMRLLLG